MVANTSLNVTSLDFNDIKNNFKNYLQANPQFSDFNYEGSAISLLLDLLAYNTYYNAVYANFIANEMFLDSASLPTSAYSIAKALNYTPRSARAASAQIQVVFSPNDSPDEIVIPKYTKFSSTINGVVYTFVTLQDYSVYNQGGVYSQTITIYEGIVLTYKFIKSITDNNLYELPVDNIDTTTLLVQIQQNSTSLVETVFEVNTDITNINASSNVYFLQKSTNGYYEIYFGDGILGKALTDGNVINATFLTCNGPNVNGAGTFTTVGYSGYNSANPTKQYNSTIISIVSNANGGQGEEDLNSIKYNAPRSYERQNRLITANDYEQYIKANYSNIQSVSVWGGEDNVPPLFGKVVIAAKPINGYVLSSTQKNQISSDLLQYSSMSIDPVFVDPVFLFINIHVTANYNSSISVLPVNEIYQEVAKVVTNFEATTLNNFGNRFRKSRLITAIDNCDSTIDSSDMTVLMEKRFAPTINSKFTYQLYYTNPFNHPYDGYLGCVSSTGFTIAGNSNTLYFDDDGYGNLRMYYVVGSKNIYINSKIGTIDYLTGSIIINSIIFMGVSGDEIRIFAQPANADISATNNQVLLLSFPVISLFDIYQNRLLYSNTVSVMGNTSLVKADGILSTVVV